MIPCRAVPDIPTPRGYSLRGLWFGPKKPERAVVWVHGLGSSLWSKLDIVRALASRGTAMLVFNNRGHDISAFIRRSGEEHGALGGAAHEKFTDCVDDIQGAVDFVRRQGVRSIFLAGHSTGCQKSVYWAHKTKGRGVAGIILLAPVSDYAAIRLTTPDKALSKARTAARALVREGKPHGSLPQSVAGWPWIADAQRFLSLYSGTGPEEIFTYWTPKRIPRALRSIGKPVLTLLAERDEYADRPAGEIAAWFDRHLRGRHEIVVVPAAGHVFAGAEQQVARAVRAFIGS